MDENYLILKPKIEILGFHAEYERNLGRLYSLFARKHPGVDLWPYLVEEERKHEAWIKQIIFKVSEGIIDFQSEAGYAEWVIKCVIDLKKTIEMLENTDFSLKESLKLCIDYEDNILEKEFFENFYSEAPAFDAVLRNLVKDTEKHRKAIVDKLNELFPEKS